MKLRDRFLRPSLKVVTRADVDQFLDTLYDLHEREGKRWPSPLIQMLARAFYTVNDAYREVERQQRTIDRYQTALLFYADPNSYDEEARPGHWISHRTQDGDNEPDFDLDGGSKAQTALGVHVREMLIGDRDVESGVRQALAVMWEQEAEKRGRR